VLLSQYFYYRKTATPTVSAFSQPRSRAGSLAYRTSRERAPSRYRTLSAAAANVATAAAALASQRNEPPTSGYVHTRWSRRSLDGLLDSDPNPPAQEGSGGDMDEDLLATLTDSVYSERSSRQRHVLWSKENRAPSSHSRAGSRHIPTSLQITSTTDDFDALARGRTLQRANLPPLDGEGLDWHQSEDGSQRRRSSRASRRGATMIFMGVWALFGIGTLGMNRYSAETPTSLQPGRVLSQSNLAPPSLLSPSFTHESPSLATADVMFDAPQHPEHTYKGEQLAPRASLERVIGRISAWSCATLYLTSRLPQIWKNVRVSPDHEQTPLLTQHAPKFVRKSVEVWSPLVDTPLRSRFQHFYRAYQCFSSSLLSSATFSTLCLYFLRPVCAPLPRSRPPSSLRVCRKSIVAIVPPHFLTAYRSYLIGSGGTLMFDVTIVTQSFIYRQRPSQRGRRLSTREASIAEEESLMRADDVEESYTSRRRLPVTAEETNVRD